MKGHNRDYVFNVLVLSGSKIELYKTLSFDNLMIQLLNTLINDKDFKGMNK